MWSSQQQQSGDGNDGRQAASSLFSAPPPPPPPNNAPPSTTAQHQHLPPPQDASALFGASDEAFDDEKFTGSLTTAVNLVSGVASKLFANRGEPSRPPPPTFDIPSPSSSPVLGCGTTKSRVSTKGRTPSALYPPPAYPQQQQSAAAQGNDGAAAASLFDEKPSSSNAAAVPPVNADANNNDTAAAASSLFEHQPGTNIGQERTVPSVPAAAAPQPLQSAISTDTADSLFAPTSIPPPCTTTSNGPAFPNQPPTAAATFPPPSHPAPAAADLFGSPPPVMGQQKDDTVHVQSFPPPPHDSDTAAAAASLFGPPPPTDASLFGPSPPTDNARRQQQQQSALFGHDSKGTSAKTADHHQQQEATTEPPPIFAPPSALPAQTVADASALFGHAAPKGSSTTAGQKKESTAPMPVFAPPPATPSVPPAQTAPAATDASTLFGNAATASATAEQEEEITTGSAPSTVTASSAARAPSPVKTSNATPKSYKRPPTKLHLERPPSSSLHHRGRTPRRHFHVPRPDLPLPSKKTGSGSVGSGSSAAAAKRKVGAFKVPPPVSIQTSPRVAAPLTPNSIGSGTVSPLKRSPLVLPKAMVSPMTTSSPARKEPPQTSASEEQPPLTASEQVPPQSVESTDAAEPTDKMGVVSAPEEEPPSTNTPPLPPLHAPQASAPPQQQQPPASAPMQPTRAPSAPSLPPYATQTRTAPPLSPASSMEAKVAAPFPQKSAPPPQPCSTPRAPPPMQVAPPPVQPPSIPKSAAPPQQPTKESAPAAPPMPFAPPPAQPLSMAAAPPQEPAVVTETQEPTPPATMVSPEDELPATSTAPVESTVPEEDAWSWEEEKEESRAVQDEEVVREDGAVSGWTELVDPTTGKTYFYNSTENLTTWEKPSALLDKKAVAVVEDKLHKAAEQSTPEFAAAVEETPQLEPTALGGPKEEEKDGSVQEQNDDDWDDWGEEDEPASADKELPEHVVPQEAENETQLPLEENEQPPLPAEWEELFDADTGRVYYFNSVDNTTSWDRPTAPPEMETAAVAAPEEEVHTQPHAAAAPEETSTPEVVQEPDENDQPAAADPEVEVSAIDGTAEKELEMDPNALPPGWVEMVDPSSGNPYYVNEIENVTTWDRPAVEALPKHDGDDLHEPDTVDEVPMDEFDGPEEIDEIPTEEFNEPGADKMGLIDDFEQETKTRVDGIGDLDGDHVVSETQPDDQMPRDSDSQNEVENTALPPGWVELVDESSGNPYYLREADGYTTWDRPLTSSQEKEEPIKGGEESNHVEEEGRPASDKAEEVAAETDAPVDDGGPSDTFDAADREFNEGAGTLSDESMRSKEFAEAEAEQVAIDEPEVPPLPAGWVELFDSASGLPYYMNEIENVSTWERPVVEASPKSGDDEFHEPDIVDEIPLDEFDGPEEIADMPTEEFKESGATNMAEAVPTRSDDDFHEPDIVDEVPVDEFDEPKELADIPSEGLNEPDAAHIAPADDFEEATENHMDGIGDLDGEHVVSETQTDDQMPRESDAQNEVENTDLPPGWVELVDESSGNPYYLREADNYTTWDRPLPSPQEEESPKVGEESNHILEEEGGPVSVKAEQVAAETDDTSGWDRPVEEPVPPEAVEGPMASETYTGAREVREGEISSETVVDDTNAVKDGPQGPIELDGHDQAEPPETVVEETFAVQDGQQGPIEFGVQDQAEPPEHEAEQNVLPPLPAGWVELMDESSGLPYYFHEEDNTTTWDRPVADILDDAAENSEKLTESIGGPTLDEPECVANDGEMDEGGSETLGDGATHVEYAGTDSQQGTTESARGMAAEGLTDLKTRQTTEAADALSPLPSGWVEIIDESSGRPYYLHEGDNITTWDRPVAVPEDSEPPDVGEEATASDEGPTSEEPDVATSLGVGDGDPSQPAGDGAAANDEVVDVDARQGSIPPDGDGQAEFAEKEAEQAVDALPSLPAGWVEIIDQSSGLPYYLHEADNLTTWDRPEASASSDAAPDGAESIDDARKPLEKHTGSDPRDELQTSKDQKPDEVEEQDNNVTEADSSLPPGWVEIIDESSGLPYYFHEADNVTTWDRPQVPGSEAGMKSMSRPTGAAEISNLVENEVGTKDLRKERDRLHPAHAIATFGFGGKLCVLDRKRGSQLVNGNNRVAVYRTHQVAPTEAVSKAERSKQISQVFGPLNSSEDNAVLAHIERQAKLDTEDGAITSALLWRLVLIAAKSRGRFRSDDGVSDPNSPEAAVLTLLLKDGSGQNSHTLSHSKSSVDAGAPVQQERKENGVNTASSLDTVQSLLLRGKREEAVQEAIASKNFTMALLVSSMCDRETFQGATRQFADEVLLAGSPLHTLAMLFSGQLHPPKDSTLDRTGAKSSFWSGSSTELLSTWRYHLAGIISNRILGWDRIVLSLGDRLQELGDVHAAHFCYMVCGCPVTSALNASSRVALVGTDHLVPANISLMVSESLESYERTEAYEWAKRRGNPQAAIQALQPFKLKYAMLLADVGLEKEARMYVKSIRQCLGLENEEKNYKSTGIPITFATQCQKETFLEALFQFEERLSLRDTQLLFEAREKSASANLAGAPATADEKVPSSSRSGTVREKTVPATEPSTMPRIVARSQPVDNTQTNKSAPWQTNGGKFSTPTQKTEAKIRTQQSRPLHMNDSTTGSPPVGRAIANANDDANDVSFLSAKSNLADITMASGTDKPSAETDRKKGADNNFPTGQANKPAATDRLMPANAPPVIPGTKKSAPSAALDEKAKIEKLMTPKETKPKTQEAPKSAPVVLTPAKPQMPEKKAPSSERSRSWGLDFGIKDKMTKWLNPDATTADIGESMQAYYDKEKKVWVFPGEDPAEKAKPIAPPPIVPSAEKKSAEEPASGSPKATPSAAPADPLAAMMAPPRRTPNAFRRSSSMPGSGAPKHAGMPPVGGPASAAKFPLAAGSPPPQFAVFKPKPAAKEEKKEDEGKPAS